MSTTRVFLGIIDGGIPVVATDDGRGRALCVTEDKHWTMTREWREVENRIRLIPEDHPNWGSHTPVHNHGTEEGPGLACREHTLTDGRLLGECMIPTLLAERDWWRDRTKVAQGHAIELAKERVEARSSVSKADIQRVVNRWWEGRGDQQELEDDLWELHEGTDPAVHVVRESDIAAVEVEKRENGDWYTGRGGFTVGSDHAAEHCRNQASQFLKRVAENEAVARAIETEQATDPVEAKAREIAKGIGWDWDVLDDEHVEIMRSVSAHVLGQEASSDE